MTGENVKHTDQYDPFVRGRFPVGVRTIQALDTARDRLFPCEIWYPAATQYAGQDIAPETQDVFTVPSRDTPRSQMAVRNAAAQPGTYPLIIFSHASGGGRRGATYLCTHLSSHGYVVAALDHSEVVAAELARKDVETREQKAALVEAVIANRVPDIRFLLDHLLGSAFACDPRAHARGCSPACKGGVEYADTSVVVSNLDPTQIGIVGHSFGGWTALAAPEVEGRIRAVVALAPGGIILRRADHMHFMDDVEQLHETTRTMPWTEELAWMPKEMRPIAELCSGEQAHLFVRGLTLCHMDRILRRPEEAQRFLAGDLEAELAARGVDVIVHKP